MSFKTIDKCIRVPLYFPTFTPVFVRIFSGLDAIYHKKTLHSTQRTCIIIDCMNVG